MMKSSLSVTGVLILTVLLAVFLTACGGGGNDGKTVTTDTISGTVTLPASVTDKPWYVAVDNDLDGGNGMVAETKGVVTGSTFSYSIPNVPSGDYYVYTDVSLTGTLGPLKSGDYVGFGCGTITNPCKVTIDSSKTVDITLSKYIKQATDTISGTVTLPASVSVTDKQWYVAVDDDLDGGNGMVAETEGVVTGSTFSYSIPNVPSGDYYVYADVSLSGTLGPWESGDYVGFGCGTITNPCKVTIDSSKTVDITLSKY